MADIVTSDQRLAAYVELCTARPAFQRAPDAQIGDFRQVAYRKEVADWPQDQNTRPGSGAYHQGEAI
jgi:hypothetical protein